VISNLEADLVTRHPVAMTADPGRVIAKLFLPGEEGNEAHSRAAGIVDRVLALPEREVAGLVASLIAVFAPRHGDYQGLLARHAAVVASRVRAPATLSPARRLPLGAAFTAEYAVEGAAVANPSAVPHPDQTGLPPGALRVALSLRCIGEGHLSSIGFGAALVGPGPTVRLEPRPGPLTTGLAVPADWAPGGCGSSSPSAASTSSAPPGSDHAFSYPSLAVNSDGEVGIALAWGGGSKFYASFAVGILGDFVVWFSEASNATDSTNSGAGSNGRWGDYVTCRQSHPDTALFSATGYAVLQNPPPSVGTQYNPATFSSAGESVAASPAP